MPSTSRSLMIDIGNQVWGTAVVDLGDRGLAGLPLAPPRLHHLRNLLLVPPMAPLPKLQLPLMVGSCIALQRKNSPGTWVRSRHV